MNRSFIIKFVAIFFTIALPIFLLSYINIDDVVNIITNIKPIYLLVGLILYACSYYLRSLRFWILLKGEVSLSNLLKIVCVHNMMNNLLPARTGELSYIYLLKKIHKRNVGEGIATLVVARVFDFLLIVGIFLSASILLQFYIIKNGMFYVIFAVIILLICVSLLICLMKADKIKTTELFEKMLDDDNLNETTLNNHILSKIKEIINSFALIGDAGLLIYFKIFITTLSLWGSLYLFYFCLAIGMNLEIHFIPAVFASSFAVFSTILPIQGIGGFGTVEGGWAIGFILIGLPETVAVASGFGFHIIVLVYTIIFGICGLFSQRSFSLRDK